MSAAFVGAAFEVAGQFDKVPSRFSASHEPWSLTDVVTAGELEHPPDASGPLPADVEVGGDADQLHAGPGQQQRQRERVVRITTEVGVEMHFHRRTGRSL